MSKISLEEEKQIVDMYMNGAKYSDIKKEFHTYNEKIKKILNKYNIEPRKRSDYYESLVGKRFGRLVVIKKDEKEINNQFYWVCKCDCGNIVTVSTNSLNSGNTRSCGCLHIEQSNKNIKKAHQANKKNNTYDLSNEYGICYDEKGNYAYFDLEDYDKLKDCYWLQHKGYMQTMKKENGKSHTIFMHNIVMDFIPIKGKYVVDHINNNPFDNRKNNLRIATISQNNMNKRMLQNNTSGITGVYLHNKTQKWEAYITINRHRKYLGVFANKDDAIKARKEAEEKYFGEFAYSVDNKE